MKEKIFSIFIFLFVISLTFALAAQGEGIGNNENTQEIESMKNLDSGIQDNQNLGEEDLLKNQEKVQMKIQDGELLGENGQMVKVQTQSNNQIKLESNGIKANCNNCEMMQEQGQDGTKLSVKMSNGQNSEIKVMPDTASQKALERLRLKVCSEEDGCSIQLKEVGEGQDATMAYELKTQRKSKFLGIFNSNMDVEAQVDAETGEIIKVNKPWWSFLATEPTQE